MKRVFDYLNCKPDLHVDRDIEQILANQAREEIQRTLAEIARQGFIGMEA